MPWLCRWGYRTNAQHHPTINKLQSINRGWNYIQLNAQHPQKRLHVDSLSRRVARRIIAPVYRPVRRSAWFLAWLFPALGELLLPKPASERRLLVIYDLFSQPFSVGDILVVQEASLVLRERHAVDVVDFAIVYDPRHPAQSGPAFTSITKDNALFNLASILPVAQVNQHLGSLFVFNSHRHLERFIVDNTDRYLVWPSGWKFATREYLFKTVFEDLLHNHFQQHGSIPHLACRPFLADWAKAFYEEHVYPQVPVSVNIRNNKAFQTHRNAHLECWLKFFAYCEPRYPAKFVIICAKIEVDDRLRACANVIIAKDYQTGVEQDLSLIHGSAFHMGSDSGPACMAIFSDKPYLVVNTAMRPNYFSNPEIFQQDSDGLRRFAFSGPLQRFGAGVETTAFLIKEFTRMWEAVGLQRGQSEVDIERKTEAEVHNWLR